MAVTKTERYLRLAGSAAKRTFVLSKPIAGFEAPSIRRNGTGHGALSELEPGTILKLIGRGFSDQAAKVLANGQAYFVFIRDIEAAEA
jgi:hypothetical protein